MRLARSGSRGHACPPPSAHRVWLPARRLAPSHALPDLFQTGGTYGILPSERSPLGKSRWRFRRRLPRMPLPQSDVFGIAEACQAVTANSASGFVLPRVPRERRVFSPPQRRLLPWASPLSGMLLTDLGKPFGPPPPTRFYAAPGYPIAASHTPWSIDRSATSPTTWAGHPS
jgi:hypothetical protein